MSQTDHWKVADDFNALQKIFQVQRGKGNFGIGQLTVGQADEVGRAFVGPNAVDIVRKGQVIGPVVLGENVAASIILSPAASKEFAMRSLHVICVSAVSYVIQRMQMLFGGTSRKQRRGLQQPEK